MNKLFYRPVSITRSENYLYVLCFSYIRSIFKISLINDRFLLESIFNLENDINLIQSGWDIELAFIDNNRLFIKDKFFKTLFTFDFERKFKIHFFKFSSIKRNTLFLIGKVEENKIKIIEIRITGKSFEKIDEFYINKIEKVAGFIDLSDNKFVISDISKNNVFVYDRSKNEKFTLCSEGRNGKSKVRKPCDIEFLNNNIFICDKHNYLLQTFDKCGSFKEQIGGKGRDLESFDLPVSLAKFSKSSLLISDMNNDRILLYDHYSKKNKIVFQRSFSKGLLARPTSMCMIRDLIYVSDRDNDVIQVFDNDQNFIKVIRNSFIARPTSVQKIGVGREEFLSILSRGDDTDGAYIFILNHEGEIIYKKRFLEFKDPQGMISIEKRFFCVSDTLNRCGILLNNKLEILKKIDLSKYSGDDRFLCRVPYFIEKEILFTDYHTGNTVVTDFKLNFIRNFRIIFSNFGLSNLRKICKYKDNYLLLGKALEGNSPVVLIKSLYEEPEILYKLEQQIVTPVDFICNKGKSILLDKELSIIKELNLPY
ncbi:hypothetical protein CUB78_06685 [Prochlorococcus marinus str. XMU1401]|uniref:Uncharacterized protein n=1 Tax=Prochlorococcus marinus str. XMU1401 TaxID=2052594 RepID=A0A8I1X4D9_PROMR|nr:hypothetical protein [Prochlorococcus marinus]MBO8223289.1 hypothetical protein [Prochlorococcus marinus str. XMU1401]MBW3059821.1 hypothetical protein [Prochlorococcus marinus str. XMU1401E]MCQ9198953.1 hypothetical protein [Prochlorococcus marinus XMU1429]PJC83635.1 hypothetical protein CUB78_06685 [Prochlorococcus marinus str. XMU1401]